MRKRVDVKLVNSQKKAIKLICKHCFHAFRIFNKDLVAVTMLKQRLYPSKPIYVWFSLLDPWETVRILLQLCRDDIRVEGQVVVHRHGFFMLCVENKDIYQDIYEINTCLIPFRSSIVRTIRKCWVRWKTRLLCLKSKMCSILYTKHDQEDL